MNYHNDQHTPPPHPPPQYRPYPLYYEYPELWYRPIRRNANIVCFGLFIVLLLGIFLMPVLEYLASFYIDFFGIENQDSLSMINMLSELFATCLMLILPVTIMRLWIGIPTEVAFPMRRPRMSIAVPSVFICLCVSVFGSLAYGLIVALLESVFGVTPYMPAFSAPIGTPAIIVYVLRVAFVPSVLEELMFRGVIMQSLRRFGDMFALVCSSVLFALAHRNMAQGVSALMVGLTIGFFVLRTGSLRTGMLIHLVNNLISVCADLISRNMTESEATAFTIIQFALYVFSGLCGLIYLLIVHSKIFYLAPSDYPVPQRRKYSVFFLTIMPVLYTLAILWFTILNFK